MQLLILERLMFLISANNIKHFFKLTQSSLRFLFQRCSNFGTLVICYTTAFHIPQPNVWWTHKWFCKLTVGATMTARHSPIIRTMITAGWTCIRIISSILLTNIYRCYLLLRIFKPNNISLINMIFICTFSNSKVEHSSQHFAKSD